jgi:hypothetical protein
MIRLRPLSIVLVSCAVAVSACGKSSTTPPLKELQRANAGQLQVVLLSAADALKQGKDQFYLEVRSASDRHLVDVGTVKVSATMPMAGMSPMIGATTVERTETVGRYAVSTDLGMAGSWRIGVEWDGPQGHGTATLPGTVR